MYSVPTQRNQASMLSTSFLHQHTCFKPITHKSSSSRSRGSGCRNVKRYGVTCTSSPRHHLQEDNCKTTGTNTTLLSHPDNCTYFICRLNLIIFTKHAPSPSKLTVLQNLLLAAKPFFQHSRWQPPPLPLPSLPPPCQASKKTCQTNVAKPSPKKPIPMAQWD